MIIAVVITILALLGLVGTQIYWISNAVNLRQANFRRSVDEAVNKVVHNLEKMETADRIRARMYEKPRGSSFMNTMDSISALFLKELDSIPWDKNTADTNLNFSGDNPIKIEITRNESGQIVKKLDTLFSDQKDPAPPYSRVSINPSVPSSAIKTLNDQFQNLWQKSYMVADVFEDLFSLGKRKNIEDRIEMKMLDSLIQHELSMKGINTEYYFGLYSSGREKMVLSTNPEKNHLIKTKGMIFRMYPNEIFMSPDYLIIYFPEQKRFLITQMAGILLVSFFLITLIILLFILAMNTIIRQRKISVMKNDFINNMTHEFKTPISTISLACEALNDKDIQKSEELINNYINMIGEENKRLGTMAEKILQTAIIEKGDLKLKEELVDVHKVLKESIGINQMQVEIKDGVIETDLKATQSYVVADHDHLLHVFNNLLDNANKYSPKKPKIVVSTRNSIDQIIISIRDNGIGISKNDQKKIFEKLYRVHTGNLHDVKGFGLGLSYVKFIVDKLDGKISLESEINQGATFKVYIPFKQEQ